MFIVPHAMSSSQNPSRVMRVLRPAEGSSGECGCVLILENLICVLVLDLQAQIIKWNSKELNSFLCIDCGTTT